MKNNIIIKNSSVNNLKNVSLEFKPGFFYVLAGPSGSGKSSLAFDVLYAAADTQGKARGIQTVYRKQANIGEVINLPQMTVGIEQQKSSSREVVSVGWYSGLSEKIIKNSKKKSFCTQCMGHGYLRAIDPGRVIQLPHKSVSKGAFSKDAKKIANFDLIWWKNLCKEYNIDHLTPFKNLPTALQDILFKGDGKKFKGFINALNLKSNLCKEVKAEFSYYTNRIPCPKCLGYGVEHNECQKILKLNLEKLVDGDFIDLNPIERKWFSRLDISDIRLNEPFFHLSSGQARRLRFFVRLIGLPNQTLVLFDEPCTGLMKNEAFKLAELFKDIAKQGHFVVVADHHYEIIKNADRIIAFGPGSGVDGGKIVFKGKPLDYLTTQDRMFKTGTAKLIKPSSMKKNDNLKYLVSDFSEWDGFQDFKIKIPLNRLVCVCGPSGSGKTSFLHAVFAACDKTPTAWQNRRNVIERKGQEYMRRPYYITSTPIGKNSFSTPATYIKVFDHIREKFAELKESKKRGFKKNSFSFLNCASRCEKCSGGGFLETLETCPKCNGTRYQEKMLSVKYKDMNIADINNLTVNHALSVFGEIPGIKRRLEFLKHIALDYLVLGQPSNSLSGGEAQRIKIAVQLTKRLGDRCIYIIDGPSMGLDRGKIPRILDSLWYLVENNNTVLIAENDPDIFLQADWLVILDNPTWENSNRRLNMIFSGLPKNCPDEILI